MTELELSSIALELQAAEMLDKAAGDIAEFGWRNNSSISEANYDKDPACVWRALQRVDQRDYPDSFAAFYKAEDALLEVSGHGYLSELYTDNDSRSGDKGQTWAYGLLIDARDLLDPNYEANHPTPVEQNWFTRKISKWFGKK